MRDMNGRNGSLWFRYVVVACLAGLTATAVAASDTDGDGIDDGADNCTLVANADQFDGDGDGYGNVCDADLDNSGRVTSADFTVLRNALNTANPVADLDHSGLVTADDYAIMVDRLNTAPGPSARHP